jgi:hypothetical protein
MTFHRHSITVGVSQARNESHPGCDFHVVAYRPDVVNAGAFGLSLASFDNVDLAEEEADDLAKRNHWSRKARLPITEAP